jgi:hypothetical protein
MLVSCFLCSVVAYAQQPWSIKVYQNSDFFSKTYSNDVTNKTSKQNEANFNRFSFAFQIHPDRQFTHEIEFFIPEINKNPEDVSFPFLYDFDVNDLRSSSVDTYSLRYEIIERISSLKKQKLLSFHTGLSVNPYYVKIDYTSDEVNVFDYNYQHFGFSFAIAPHLKVNFTKKLRLDINVPINLYTLRVEAYKTEDPAASSSRKETQEAFHKLFQKVYSLRVGISYQFNEH